MIYEPTDLNIQLVALWNSRERRTDNGKKLVAKAVKAIPSTDYPANEWHEAFTSLPRIEITPVDKKLSGYMHYSIPILAYLYNPDEILAYALEVWSK